jgi:hypothetical protein
VRVIQQVDSSTIRINWMMLRLPIPSFIGMLLDAPAWIQLLRIISLNESVHCSVLSWEWMWVPFQFLAEFNRASSGRIIGSSNNEMGVNHNRTIHNLDLFL